MIDVVSIGETMLVFRPTNGGLIERASTFDCITGGSEANFLIALTRLGLHCSWVSGLPDSPLGRKVIAEYNGIGLDTSGVIMDPAGRVGLMFIEMGQEPRPNKVYYDRKGSSFSCLTPSTIDWSIICSARHLHLTGITPALGENSFSLCLEALQRAKDCGVSISLDTNYRSSLWSTEVARTCLVELIKFTDLLIISKKDADSVFEYRGADDDVLDLLKTSFGEKIIILTLGDRGAIASWRNDIVKAEAFPCVLKNRFGIGDAFAAGVVYGYLRNNIEEGLKYGTVLAALKSTLLDINIPLVNREDVIELVDKIGGYVHDPSNVKR